MILQLFDEKLRISFFFSKLLSKSISTTYHQLRFHITIFYFHSSCGLKVIASQCQIGPKSLAPYFLSLVNLFTFNLRFGNSFYHMV